MKRFIFFQIVSIFAMFCYLTAANAQSGMRISEKYPDLSRGVLSQAMLQDLPNNVLVRVNEREITLEMLAQKVDSLPEEEKDKVSNFLFYLLEEMVERPIVLTMVLGSKTLPEDNEQIQEIFKSYINKVVGHCEVTEKDALTFYEAHPEIFKALPFEENKEEIIQRLLAEKQQAAWSEHLRNIGLQVPIAVNAAWVDAQVEKIKDNPVDKIRGAGKPVMAVFTAEWCPACQELKPVMSSLIEKKQQDISITVIDLGQDGMLARKYGITVIPAILFFDKSGSEIARDTGFMPEEKLLEKINALFGEQP